MNEGATLRKISLYIFLGLVGCLTLVALGLVADERRGVHADWPQPHCGSLVLQLECGRGSESPSDNSMVSSSSFSYPSSASREKYIWPPPLVILRRCAAFE